jgi:hypothetical protein
MSAPNRTERDLYQDLTSTVMSMKDAPFAAVQAAIEQRFRQYLLAERQTRARALQITWTCALPEGPGSFAVYRTEYQTVVDDHPATAAACPASARSAANVIPFPTR